MTIKKLSLTLVTLTTLVLAPLTTFASPLDKPREALELDTAITLAISNSTTIQNLTENIPQSQTDLNRTENLPNFSSLNTIVAWQADVMTQRARVAANIANAAAQRDTLGFIVTQHFANIAQLETNLTLFDQQLDLTEQNLNISRLQSELGIISELDYLLADLSFNELLLNRTNLESAVVQAHMDLNRLLGLDETLIHDITFDPTYELLPPQVNLTGFINTQRQNHINVRQAVALQEVAIFNLENFSLNVTADGIIMPGNAGAPTRAQRQLELNEATRNVTAARNQITVHLQDTYTAIRELEHNLETAAIELADLKNNLATATVQLEVGSILPITLDNIALQIANKEADIRQMHVNHALLVMQFRNPNILVF